jgi:uncharacterized membrane protein YbaN (DUF454 family)
MFMPNQFSTPPVEKCGLGSLQRLMRRFSPYLRDHSLPAESRCIYHCIMMRKSQRGQIQANDEVGQPCSDIQISTHVRVLYLVLGWCFFGLGALGAALPGLPTTPFMLLALWAFSKSSRRFHDWLYTHPLFGPPLQQWCSYRVIPFKAKLLAIVTMALSFVYLAFFTEISTWIKLSIALLMLYGAVFILSKPSRVPEGAPQPPSRQSGPV